MSLSEAGGGNRFTLDAAPGDYIVTPFIVFQLNTGLIRSLIVHSESLDPNKSKNRLAQVEKSQSFPLM